MRHLTKKGFVHRDLVARNILLNESLRCVINLLTIEDNDIICSICRLEILEWQELNHMRMI